MNFPSDKNSTTKHYLAWKIDEVKLIHLFVCNFRLKILSYKDYATVRKLLSDMTKRGLIMRIKDGLYHRIPYEQQPDQYFPNWHLTAEAIAQPKEHYIGFYSALNIHGLITQPAKTEQVVTWGRVKPRDQQVKNVRFEFITWLSTLSYDRKLPVCF